MWELQQAMISSALPHSCASRWQVKSVVAILNIDDTAAAEYVSVVNAPPQHAAIHIDTGVDGATAFVDADDALITTSKDQVTCAIGQHMHISALHAVVKTDHLAQISALVGVDPAIVVVTFIVIGIHHRCTAIAA